MPSLFSPVDASPPCIRTLQVGYELQGGDLYLNSDRPAEVPGVASPQECCKLCQASAQPVGGGGGGRGRRARRQIARHGLARMD